MTLPLLPTVIQPYSALQVSLPIIPELAFDLAFHVTTQFATTSATDRGPEASFRMNTKAFNRHLLGGDGHGVMIP